MLQDRGLIDEASARSATRVGIRPPGAAAGPMIRRRPLDLPLPELVQDVTGFEGYCGVAFWPREDSFLLHPPRRDAICAVCRDVPVAGVVQVSASVQAAREDGPPIAFGIGLSRAGAVSAENWFDCTGPLVHVAPGAWGVVTSAMNGRVYGDACDIVLVTQVAGSLTNDNAWALFRRFSFRTSHR